MLRAWLKLMKYHAWKIIIVLALMAWALAVFPWEAWSYDSMTTNANGSHTYTITSASSGNLDDGYMRSSSIYGWAVTRAGGGSCTMALQMDDAHIDYSIDGYKTGDPDVFQVARTVVPFDTSGITDSVVASATLYLTAGGASGELTGVTVFATGHATLPLSTTYWNSFEATEIATRSAWTAPAWYPGTAVTSTLNTAGLASLASDLGSNFQAWLMADSDYDNVTPTKVETIRAGIYFAETTTEAYRPQLVFTSWTFSDFFDDASLSEKWTTGDFYGGGGTITETGGYLALTTGASTSAPYIVFNDGLQGTSWDVRQEIHLDPIPSNDAVMFGAVADYLAFPSNAIYVQYESGTKTIYRVDSGVSGPSIALNNKDFVLRVVRSGNDFTFYVKTDPCATAWTELSPASTGFTYSGTTMDFFLVDIKLSGDVHSIYSNWIVMDAENSGYPLACAASPVIFCE